MSDLRVIVNGALGRMGRQTCEAVEGEPDLRLVARTDAEDDLATAIAEHKADVVVDFTHPSSARANADIILDGGARGVIGTTGFTADDIDALSRKAEEKGLGMVIAPNFAIGVILMMRFAEQAVKHFPAVEIIELHHDRKADAPSGTAAATAERLLKAREQEPPPRPPEKETLPGARGGSREGIRIHSVRLPGLLAHQEVIFGGAGQVLTVRHDTSDRAAFMPGVILAVRKVVGLSDLVFGLDDLL
jgi:4-hydroxy-tetrahydrodipicolinate reductase